MILVHALGQNISFLWNQFWGNSLVYAWSTPYAEPSCSAKDVTLVSLENIDVTDICTSAVDTATLSVDYTIKANSTSYDILWWIAFWWNVIFDACLDSISTTSGIFTDEDWEWDCGDLKKWTYTVSDVQFVVSCDPDGDWLINSELISNFMFGWTSAWWWVWYDDTVSSPKCSASPSTIKISSTVDVTKISNWWTDTFTFDSPYLFWGPIAVATTVDWVAKAWASNFTVWWFNTTTQWYEQDIVITESSVAWWEVSDISCTTGWTKDISAGTYTIPASSISVGDAISCTFTNDTVSSWDITEPVVTLSGSATVVVTEWGIYTEEGATWTDNVDGSWVIVVATSGSVDVNTIGEYTLEYTYIDVAWNEGNTVSRTVEVSATPDITEPVVTLSGSETVIVTEWGIYTEEGATWTDNVDGSGVISVATSGSVDVNTIGEYTLEYTYIDVAWNEGNTVSRTVEVSATPDITEPVVTLSGSETVIVTEWGVYTEEGATWTDNVDGSGVISVATSGSVDVNTIGEYTLEYTYIDVAWNEGNTVSRTVEVSATPDITEPVVTLSGSETVIVTEWGIYTEEGATWTDNVDGSWVIVVATSGSVDVNTVWTYILEYTYTDWGWNSDTVTRTIQITESWDTDWDWVDDFQETLDGTDWEDSCSSIWGTPSTLSDCDWDGVTKSEEEGSPLGLDVNNDSIDDSEQEGIITAINPNVWSHTTTIINWCSIINSAVTYYIEPDFASEDIDYDYYIGLHGFDVDCGVVGSTVDVKYYWDKVYDTSRWNYRKYLTASNTYIDFNSQVTYWIETVNGTTVTTVSFSITDGWPYDADGIANGEIFDPVGPTIINQSWGGGSASHISNLNVSPSDETDIPPYAPKEHYWADDESFVSELNEEKKLITKNIKEKITIQNIWKESNEGTSFLLPISLPNTGADINMCEE